MPLSEKKRQYNARLLGLLQDYRTIFMVQADNVGSKQMQQIRMALRGQGEVLMGKNTTIRKVLKDFLAQNAGHPIKNLIPHIQGNVGFVFTNGDLAATKDIILSNRVPAPARVGSIAPVDVFVEPGPTGCDPGQTSWFPALNIPTKINRGQIEMISRVHLVALGEKVGNSEAALLQKLDIRPFEYGLEIKQVYDDGECFDPAVLDLTEADIMGRLTAAAGFMSALCLEIGYPTTASLVHSLNNAYKACIAIALESDYSFDRATEFADFIANPANFAPAAGAAGGGAAEAAAPVEEESEEESAGGAGGLFDDDEDDW
jgi:large subunit ribosomal protein LP0